MLAQLNLDSTRKGLSSNGNKEDKVVDEEECDKDEARDFRAVTARMNYISQDSPDLQFPVKQASKDMARPKRTSWDSLRKLGRYLVYRGRVVWKYVWQDEPKFSSTFGDSDWGGTHKDRKSTSGGTFMLDLHGIKTWN